MAETIAPRKIRLEARHFIVRTAEADDVSPRWSGWLADPLKTRMLNANPITLSVDQIRNYVGGFDHVKSHILGVFDRASGDITGFWEVYVEWAHREFLLNVLIGERGRAAINAREESQQVICEYFFRELDLAAMRCSVVSTNTLMLRVMVDKGADHVHTSQKVAAGGGSPIQLLHFRLSKDAWALARARRLERERAQQVQS